MEDKGRGPGDALNEQERPDGEGRPPRPATEPKGSERSTQTRKTATDPATGVPTGGKRQEP